MFGLGQRRASSAQPYIPHHRSWTMPLSNSMSMSMLQRDDSPLPDVDTSLFNQSFFENTAFGVASALAQPHMDFSDFMGQQGADLLGPLDGIPPHEQQQQQQQQHDNNNIDFNNIDPTLQPQGPPTTSSFHDHLDLDPLSWMDISLPIHSSSSSNPHSHPSTAYSSPAPHSPSPLILHAPQPLPATATQIQTNTQTVFTDLWQEFTQAAAADGDSFDAGVGLGLNFGEFMRGGSGEEVDHHHHHHNMDMDVMCGQHHQDHHTQFAHTGQGLESLFEPQMMLETVGGEY